jgi:hypothetical protein
MLRYIELKTGHNDDGPAWIGEVRQSRSGRTLYFNGKAFQRAKGGASGNYLDVETGEVYWISGVKKRGHDRHWAGYGKITIEARVVNEYLQLVGSTELDRTRFTVSDSIVATDLAQFHERQNERL